MSVLTSIWRHVKEHPWRGSLAIALAALLPACDWMPGKPTQAQAWHSPHSVVDFETIYTENCRGCHGTKDEPSGAITMDNPTYIAVIPRDTLRSIIAGGVTGTAMVAFSEEHGGMLTEKQIDVLVEGIAALGAKNPPPGPLPAYSAPLGDVAARPDGIRHLLRKLPRRGRNRRQSGLRRSPGISRSGQRSISADDRYCGSQ